MRTNQGDARNCQFEIEEKRRKVQDLERMIEEFQRMAQDLDQQIHVEQERAGVRDANHFAYPTFAKAAAKRRQNLLASIDDLGERLAAAHVELESAMETLQRAETVERRPGETTRGRGRRVAEARHSEKSVHRDR